MYFGSMPLSERDIKITADVITGLSQGDLQMKRFFCSLVRGGENHFCEKPKEGVEVLLRGSVRILSGQEVPAEIPRGFWRTIKGQEIKSGIRQGLKKMKISKNDQGRAEG